MILFFGCRNKYGDDFFRDDWNEYMNKVNLKIFTAYSRDQVCFKILVNLLMHNVPKLSRHRFGTLCVERLSEFVAF